MASATTHRIHSRIYVFKCRHPGKLPITLDLFRRDGHNSTTAAPRIFGPFPLASHFVFPTHLPFRLSWYALPKTPIHAAMVNIHTRVEFTRDQTGQGEVLWALVALCRVVRIPLLCGKSYRAVEGSLDRLCRHLSPGRCGPRPTGRNVAPKPKGCTLAWVDQLSRSECRFLRHAPSRIYA